MMRCFGGFAWHARPPRCAAAKNHATDMRPHGDFHNACSPRRGHAHHACKTPGQTLGGGLKQVNARTTHLQGLVALQKFAVLPREDVVGHDACRRRRQSGARACEAAESSRVRAVRPAARPRCSDDSRLATASAPSRGACVARRRAGAPHSDTRSAAQEMMGRQEHPCSRCRAGACRGTAPGPSCRCPAAAHASTGKRTVR